MIQNLESFKTDSLLLQRTLEIFSDITDIPRPSKGEGKIQKFLYEFAEKQGWQVFKDTTGNLVVHVPPTPGQAKKKRIVLQGHMDMVNMGGNESKATDAHIQNETIEMDSGETEHPFLKTIQNETTLGADNALFGIAAPLAFLSDTTVQHGPITLIFTVDEEDGMSGARNLDKNLLPQDAAMIFNLDAENRGMVFAGAAGNRSVDASMKISERTDILETHNVYTLTLRLPGLDNRHSGSGLGWKNGNISATEILMNHLQPLLKKYPEDIQFIAFDGGDAPNAIPETFSVQLAIPPHIINELMLLTRPATPFPFEGKLVIQENLQPELKALRHEIAQKVLSVLTESPKGPTIRSEDAPFVLVSNNIGQITTDEKSISLRSLARAATKEGLDEIVDQMTTILGKNDFQISLGEYNPPWENEEPLPAVQLVREAMQAVLGIEPRIVQIHASVETGLVRDKFDSQDISAASFGVAIHGAHSKKERADLVSLEESLNVLRYILEHSP